MNLKEQHIRFFFVLNITRLFSAKESLIPHGSFPQKSPVNHLLAKEAKLVCCNNSFISATPHSMCAMTHSHVCHDSFTCVPWLIHMCAMTHVYDLFHNIIFSQKKRERRAAPFGVFMCVCHDSFISATTHSYVPWPIHMRHDYMCLIHICATKKPYDLNHICANKKLCDHCSRHFTAPFGK